MPHIVISYRRAADRADGLMTRRIFDSLVAKYGAGSVFMDTEAIRPGADFRDQIAKALRGADAMLVIVGEKWLGLKGGHSRIKEPTDWVRIEVETALATKVPVFPVLVGKGKMPTVDQLPDSLVSFSYIHAATVDEAKDFHRDLGELIGWINLAIEEKKQAAADAQAAAHAAIVEEEKRAAAATQAAAHAAIVEEKKRAAAAQATAHAAMIEEEKKAAAAAQAAAHAAIVEEEKRAAAVAPAAPVATIAGMTSAPTVETAALQDGPRPIGSGWENGRNFLRKHRSLALVSAACAALLLLGLVGILGPSLWGPGKAPPNVVAANNGPRSEAARVATRAPVSPAAPAPSANLPAPKPAEKDVSSPVPPNALSSAARTAPPAAPPVAQPTASPRPPAGRPLAAASAASSCGARTATAVAQGGPFQPVVLTPDNPADIHAVAISPDATLIATAGDDGLVRLWSTASFKLLHTFSGHEKPVYGLDFGPGGKLLASAGWDGKVRIWDVDSKQPVRVLEDPDRPPADLFSVAFTSTQPSTVLRYVVAAGGDGIVRIWDMTQETAPILRDDHNVRKGGRQPKEKDAKDLREFSTTRSMSFAPDGSGEFVTGGFDGTLRFHLKIQRRVEAVNANAGKVLGVAYSPNGDRVVSAGGDEGGRKYLKVWNVKDRSLFKSLDGHTSYVVAAAWSSNARHIATGGGDKSIRIWDANTGEQIQMYAKAHASDVEAIAFVPGTTRFVSVSEDGTMKVWDIQGGELLTVAAYGDRDYLAFTPAGCYAGSAGIESRFKLTSAGRDVPFGDSVRRAQFVPEGFALGR